MSYLASNIGELYESAPPDIQTLIHGGEVNNATSILGKLYKLPVSQYVTLSNVISYLLIGAIKPEDAVTAIMDMLGFTQDDATRLAQDLEKTILEKARIRILGKAATEMVTLTFEEGRSPDELRKEILDTTKRGPLAPAANPPVQEETSPASPITSPEAAPAPQKPSFVAGSRSALMEQLKLLDDIPDDDEVNERLQKIRDQISTINRDSGRDLDANVPLQGFLPKSDSPSTVLPSEQPATYSKAPTKYNVDPYREVFEE
jgi:hypothetical protein